MINSHSPPSHSPHYPHPLKARSPAKLILSGEHAVVHGAPAIAMAVNRYADISIAKHFSPAIFFNFLNLRYAKSLTQQALSLLKDRLQEQYDDFLKGRCGIRDVLKKPFELLQFTVSNLVDKLNIPLPQGLEIKTHSDIPMGCGMGSSAATVISTLFALAHFFNLDCDPKRILSLGKEAENLQHGYSSGLDLHLVLQGGCLKFQEGKTFERPLPKFPMTLVQTGAPLVSTGECVMQTAAHFKTGSLKDDFQAVTEKFDEINKLSSMSIHDLLEIQECIRINHRLLVKIGVVPEKVQAFVEEVEKNGGAAKICGAGSIQGNNAGVLLVVSENDHSALALKYGYPVESLKGELLGTRLV